MIIDPEKELDQKDLKNDVKDMGTSLGVALSTYIKK
jgi:hypothetical protein